MLFVLNDVHKQPEMLPRSDKTRLPRFFDSCKQSWCNKKNVSSPSFRIFVRTIRSETLSKTTYIKPPNYFSQNISLKTMKTTSSSKKNSLQLKTFIALSRLIEERKKNTRYFSKSDQCLYIFATYKFFRGSNLNQLK